MLHSLLFAALAAATPVAPAARSDTMSMQGAMPHITVTVDSAQSRIIVTAGPYDLPDMAGMNMEHMEHGAQDVLRFAWPVDGYLRGFWVEMRDAHGNPLPRSILHHLIGVNFDRRQLVYHSVERLFGWGAETDKVVLPGGLGVPLPKGDHLGVYAMFHNETGKAITGAYLRVILPYIPNRGNRVTSVYPFYVDVNNHIGGVTTFDVPPGRSEHSYEFELPVGVRMIGIGGHLHDYGSYVELQDAASGKVLARLSAQRDAEGHVSGVGRFMYGYNTDALHLLPHHPYRVIAVYDNPTKATIPDGGMGHINGAVIPDDPSKWPALDLKDPLVRKDIEALPIMKDMGPGAGHGRR